MAESTIKKPKVVMGNPTTVTLPYTATEHGFLVCQIRGGAGNGYQTISTTNGNFVCSTISGWGIDTMIPLAKGVTASQGASNNITSRTYRFVPLTAI